MPDTQAVPPAGNRDVQPLSGDAGQLAPLPAGIDGGATKAVVVTISLLGVLLTGLCLVVADRLDRSAPARILAVLAVVAALVAVLVALGAQLSALLGRKSTASTRPAGRRSALVVLSAGVLSGLAVLLAGAAALLVVQARGAAAGTTEPALLVSRGSTVDNMQTVTAQVSFPGLRPGDVLNATMVSVQEGSANRDVLTRSVLRVGQGGPAVLQLLAPVTTDSTITIEATTADRTCTVWLLPSGSGADGPPTCTRR